MKPLFIAIVVCCFFTQCYAQNDQESQFFDKTDTIGVSKSPVKVLSAKMINVPYSDRRNLEVTIYNSEEKDIKAIRMKWCILNAFGEPADVMKNNTGQNGFYDQKLKGKRREKLVWNIYSVDGKSVYLAWPTEVIFTDGTKWNIELKKD